jgi:hypothetical protein
VYKPLISGWKRNLDASRSGWQSNLKSFHKNQAVCLSIGGGRWPDPRGRFPHQWALSFPRKAVSSQSRADGRLCRRDDLVFRRWQCDKPLAALLNQNIARFKTTKHPPASIRYFEFKGTRRRSSSKKFIRKITWSCGSCGGSAGMSATRRVPSGAGS